MADGSGDGLGRGEGVAVARVVGVETGEAVDEETATELAVGISVAPGTGVGEIATLDPASLQPTKSITAKVRAAMPDRYRRSMLR